MALQMSWQPSLLSHKRKTGPPLGLRNLGNSCYLNSVLQCLTYTPPLANFCLNNLHSSLCDSCVDAERKRDCPFCILEKRIVRSLRGDLVQDAPAKIQSCLRLFAEHFRSGRQEDAHEFLRYVIDACHNTCLRLKKLRQHQRKGSDVANGKCNGSASGSGSTIVKEIFGGALQSQVRCLSCGAESNKVDDIMDMSLEVLHSNSLKESLHKFFQPEILDGNNKYKCGKCKKLVAAKKQMSIFQAPNILVVQLKRFEGFYGGKIDKTIQFEETLMLSSFMSKASQDPSPEYRLFGTIVHAGCSPDSGHYYAYIKDAIGRWYCCNDSYVTLATMEEVLSEKVYILFFSRTKQRPPSGNSSSTFIVNGVTSQSCNGNEPQKSQATAPTSKPLKPLVEESSWKAVCVTSKATKVPSGPRMKFSISGSVVSKRIPAINNGNAEAQKIQLVENMDTKETLDAHKGEKVKPKSAMTENYNKENGVIIAGNEKRKASFSRGDNSKKENGVINAGTEKGLLVKNHKANKVNEISSDKSHAFVSENGTGKARVLDPVESCKEETNGIVKSNMNGTGPSHLGYCNGGDHSAESIGSKRKLQENSCILLTRNAQSHEKIEELKQVLKNKASLVLRTCGWSDEVYNFMHMKKRICTREAVSLDSSNVREKLVEDAKLAFLSKIPESLKEDLIGHLRTFSKETQ